AHDQLAGPGLRDRRLALLELARAQQHGGAHGAAARIRSADTLAREPLTHRVSALVRVHSGAKVYGSRPGGKAPQCAARVPAAPAARAHRPAVARDSGASSI